MSKPKQPEPLEGSWWCSECRRLVWAPTRQDCVDHLLDSHREDLISGRITLQPEAH